MIRTGSVAGVALGLALAVVPLAQGCASSSPAAIGGLEPYRVNGRTYVPLRDWKGYEEEGIASWYGGAHHGRKTASGERFDAYGELTAAHKTLPFNVCAAVENLRSGQRIVVRINDRGPFAKGRVIDLSRAAASELGLLHAGVARVRVEALGVATTRGECRI